MNARMERSPESTPDVFTMARRVDDIRNGYLALDAALRLVAESIDDSDDKSPEWIKLPGDITYRRDHVEALGRDPDVAREIRRAYLSGALLSVGDILADEQYLDRSPEFEFVRHIRNAVAHGNVFELKASHLEMLEKFPAYLIEGDGHKTHAIKESVNGRECLFGFVGPNHVLAALTAAAMRMVEIRFG